MPSRLRAMLPRWVKRPLRRIANVFLEVRRRAALRRGVAALREEVRRGEVTPGLIARMHEAWGNSGYSADVSYLAAASTRSLARGGPWLECGSGLSTVVLAVLAEVRGERLWSLEQDAEWHARVAADLRLLNLSNVELWYAPLRAFADFVWYDLGDRALPEGFTLIFCDGPSVEPRQWPPTLFAGWRVGVVPVLRQRGVGIGEILLDDADDPRCAALRRRWADLGIPTEEIVTPTGGFIQSVPAEPSGRK